jgi:predicted transcriptional regulator of viral defense system
MDKSRKTYNLSKITKKILESGFILFNNQTLRDLSGIKNKVSFSAVVKRLQANDILSRLEKNKYLIKNRAVNPFNLANLLYAPSYISFETALNFYGILSQFPHELSSATVKKTVSKKIMGQQYSYTHLKPELFFGFVKRGGVLIAEPEKALLDQVYLAQKGWKKINLAEYDFSRIKKGRLKEYYGRYPRAGQTKKMAETVNKILELC